MKLKFASIAIAISMLVTGCGSSSEDAASKTDPTSSSNSDVSPSVKWSEILKAEISEFSVSKTDCSYDDGSLELLVKLTNISSSEILAIDASGEVQDLFGDTLMVLNISSDKQLSPGKTVNVGTWGSSCFGLNNYDSDQLRLMEMSNVSELTKVVINVSKIALKDGEVLEF
jgi:hypothetical protein